MAGQQDESGSETGMGSPNKWVVAEMRTTGQIECRDLRPRLRPDFVGQFLGPNEIAIFHPVFMILMPPSPVFPVKISNIKY